MPSPIVTTNMSCAKHSSGCSTWTQDPARNRSRAACAISGFGMSAAGRDP